MSKKQVNLSKKSTRIFSKKALSEFSKGFMELAIEALNKGDYENVRYWCKREAETNPQLHDLFVNWITGLLSYIDENMGEEAAVNAIRDVLAPKASIPELIALRKQNLEAWIHWCVDMWRQHSTNPGLKVEEDDEKFVLTLKCGSGGMLLRSGAYQGKNGYKRLKKPGPQTWGEKNVPIYCAHCTRVHELMPIQIGGQGSQFWVHVSPFPKKPEDPCIHYIYKNPKDIPAKYYKRFGLVKK